MIALNYQTVDSSQILNQALFEQNSNTGYVLKPEVLWNKCHPDYGKFNPYEKKKDGNYLSLTIRVISGQYLIEFNNNNNGSFSSATNLPLSTSIPQINLASSNHLNYTSNIIGQNNASSTMNLNYHKNNGIESINLSNLLIEIEIIGIPCDCYKEKTKTINRNSINPTWNEEFIFHVSFFYFNIKKII